MSEHASKLREVLSTLTTRLAACSETPRLDAELLLCRAIDANRSYLYAYPDDELDSEAAARLEGLLQRRLSGEPLAYIDGRKEFWSMHLVVSPAVLVPRPETERLVDLALAALDRQQPTRVLDVGTGSGAIALAIARERPNATVVATDVSQAALDVASINAREQMLGNIEFHLGNWLEPVRNMTFELLLSNPPYIKEGDPHLAALGFEPELALKSGKDGLDACRVLARDGPAVLAADGIMMLEHGAEQAQELGDLLSQHGWRDIRNHLDFAGLPRVTVAVAPS